MSKTTDLTRGKVSSVILGFFFPMLFTNMLQQIYNIADTAIVGKGLGDNSLAAVGNMGSVCFLIFGFAMGLSNGFSVIIAQHFGAKDGQGLRRSIAASVKLSGAIAAVLTVLSVVFMRDILVIMHTDGSIINESLRYGYIVFGGLAATIAYNLCGGILRALGDSRTPFKAIIISSAMNITLDTLFIFVLKTGVEGAAAATVFSQLVSASICYRKLRSIELIRLSREDFAQCGTFYDILIKNGLPMALMNSITAIGCIVVQYFVNGMGVAYTSAYSACSKYVNLFMNPASTAGYTISSYTSQNYGAKNYERIRSGLRVCITIAAVSYVILGSLMVFFPRMLAGLMLNGEKPIALAAEFLPITGIMLFAVDFLFVFRNGVQGMGFPTVPMLSGIFEMVMRVAVIVSLTGTFGFRTTAFAEVAAWLGALLINMTAFRYYLGKKLRTEEPVRAKLLTQKL